MFSFDTQMENPPANADGFTQAGLMNLAAPWLYALSCQVYKE